MEIRYGDLAHRLREMCRVAASSKRPLGEILRIRTRASPKNLNNRKFSNGQSSFRHTTTGTFQHHGQLQCTQSRLPYKFKVAYCLREYGPFRFGGFRPCASSKSLHCRNFRTSQSLLLRDECPRLKRREHGSAPTRLFGSFSCQYHFLNSLKISLANPVFSE